MRAIAKTKAGTGLEMIDAPIPEIGINDVLIKISRTSICGTDVHIGKWDEWARNTIKPPMIIGHEFVGKVEGIGANVHDVKIGDLVSGEGHIVCGHCRNCLAGRRHLCAHTYGIGVNRDGAFAEYVAIPVSNVWHCSPNIPLDILSCFDPLGNAAHSALSFPVLGEDVLITGAGPIGIMAAAIVRHAGARHVVITDVNPWRLKLAEKAGVTVAVNPNETTIERVQQDLGMKEGFDVGLEMSGNPIAFEQMLENMCHGGKIALLGILPPHTEVNWDYVIFNGLTIKGIYGREMYETWYKMTTMLESGLDISPVITHHFHYTEFEAGFKAMSSGTSGKVILNWEE